MEKKNTGLIVLVVVLSLLVVGLGGYIVYDKILNNGVSDNGNAVFLQHGIFYLCYNPKIEK